MDNTFKSVTITRQPLLDEMKSRKQKSSFTEDYHNLSIYFQVLSIDPCFLKITKRKYTCKYEGILYAGNSCEQNLNIVFYHSISLPGLRRIKIGIYPVI